MLENQISTLNKMAEDLWKKASLTAKPNEVAQLTELALKCMADAREIFESKRHNSVLLYAECCLGAEKQPDYAHYLDFCARNGLAVISGKDFFDVLADVGFVMISST